MTPGDELLFLALGGSGEIGMNVNLYGCRGKWLMVDCGLTFGDADYPGIDLILPDLEFIEKRKKDLVGLVITHGHEDHIGAIPYLAADLKVPIYATRFTAGLIAGKLEEEGLTGQVPLKIIDPTRMLELDPFKIGFVPLAHSIPEMHGLVIDTPHGRIFHTGDWKIDDTPVIGNATKAETLSAIGDEGVLAMMSDSTNAFSENASGSEADVLTGLLETVGKAKGRVLATTFASNVARLDTLGRVAEQTGRRVCVAGRSLDRILKVAKATGYLRDFPEPVRFDDAMRLPKHELLIVATGGQGEARAALGRIAFQNHDLKMGLGDTVIFSSRQIPGNEDAVGRVMNALSDLGCITITDRQAHVHVSGHPGRPELANMYKWIRPKILVPIHGEARHLREQARFGIAQGIEMAIVQKDGDLLRLAPGQPKILSKERVGRLVLDGDVILPADGTTMNERRKLAVNGLLAISIAVDRNGKLLGDPAVQPLGLPVEADRADFLRDCTDVAARAVTQGHDDDKMRDTVRLAVRRCATLWTGKKPLVEVLVVRTR